MDNIIVASFKDEKSATEGMKRLKALESLDDIVIYNELLLQKTSNGNFEYLEKNTEGGKWHTLREIGLGGLVGLFGGPAGVVIGMMAGPAVGGVADLGRESFDEAFIDKVTLEAPIGTTSIIAEIGEPDASLVDQQLEPLGAQIFRNSTHTEQKRFIRSRIKTWMAERKVTKEEVRQSRADDIAAVKDGYHYLRDEQEARLTDIKGTIREERAEDKESFAAVHDELSRKIDKAKIHRLRKQDREV